MNYLFVVFGRTDAVINPSSNKFVSTIRLQVWKNESSRTGRGLWSFATEKKKKEQSGKRTREIERERLKIIVSVLKP